MPFCELTISSASPSPRLVVAKRRASRLLTADDPDDDRDDWNDPDWWDDEPDDDAFDPEPIDDAALDDFKFDEVPDDPEEPPEELWDDADEG